MSFKSEWRKMEKVWDGVFTGRGIEVRAKAERLSSGSWHAFLNLRFGGYDYRLVESWPAFTEESAYANLFEEYQKNDSWLSPRLRGWEFPPCSSAEELELTLAVEGKI